MFPSQERVFNIEIETCSECGSGGEIIACIEHPVVIEKILPHQKEKAASKRPIPCSTFNRLVKRCVAEARPRLILRCGWGV